MRIKDGIDAAVKGWVALTGDEGFRDERVIQILFGGKRVTKSEMAFLKGCLSPKGYEVAEEIVSWKKGA